MAALAARSLCPPNQGPQKFQKILSQILETTAPNPRLQVHDQIHRGQLPVLDPSTVDLPNSSLRQVANDSWTYLARRRNPQACIAQ